jgi:hypothetical protein
MQTVSSNATGGLVSEERHGTPVEAATRSPEKQRGLLSFLTWPFVLAQVFAVAELLAARSASAHENEESAGPSKPAVAEDSAAPLEAILNPAERSLARADEEPEDRSSGALVDGSLGNAAAEPEAPESDGEGGTVAGRAGALGIGGGGSGGGGGRVSGSDDADEASLARGHSIRPDRADEDRTDDVNADGMAPSDFFGSAPIPWADFADDRLGPEWDASAPPFLEALPPLSDAIEFGPEVVIGNIGTGPLAKPTEAVFTAATNAAGDVLETVEPIIAAVGPVATEATTVVGEAADAVEPVVDAVGPLATAAGNVVGETVEPVTDAVSPVLNAATEVVGDAVRAVESVVDAVGPVLTAATNVVGDAVRTVEPVVDAVGPVLSAATDVVGDAVRTVEPVVDAVGPVLTAATDVVGDVVEAVEPVVAAVSPALTAATDVVGDARETVEPVVDAVRPGATAATDMVGNAAETIESVADAALPGSSSAISPAGDEQPAEESVLDSVWSAPAETGPEKSQDAAPAPALAESPASDAATSPEEDAARSEPAPVLTADNDPAAASSDEGDVLASAGTLEFDDVPAPEPTRDDLFADGRHTDYGLALRADATDARAGPAFNPDQDNSGDPAPAPRQDQQPDGGQDGVAADAAPADADLPVMPPVADLTGALEDAGIRGGDTLI